MYDIYVLASVNAATQERLEKTETANRELQNEVLKQVRPAAPGPAITVSSLQKKFWVGMDHSLRAVTLGVDTLTLPGSLVIQGRMTLTVQSPIFPTISTRLDKGILTTTLITSSQ